MDGAGGVGCWTVELFEWGWGVDMCGLSLGMMRLDEDKGRRDTWWCGM